MDTGAHAPPSPERNKLSSAENLTELSGRERAKIDEKSRPSAALIHETIRAEGESELDRSTFALVLSGFAAGLTMGFSLIVQGLLKTKVPEAPGQELIVALGYTVGFIVVVLGRQQLFTENTLTPVLPLLHNRDRGTFMRVLRLWGLVLAANVAATACVAFVLAKGTAFSPEVKAAFAQISHHAMGEHFWTTVLKGIFAGWIIALMVWLLPGAETSRLLIVLILTYVVAIGSFAHIIAGSVDAFYLVWIGQASMGDYLYRFFLPTLIGNVVGGVTLVAALNYGQVAHEVDA